MSDEQQISDILQSWAANTRRNNKDAILANHAAGIVVGKVGTATVSQSELQRDFESRNANSAG